VLSSPLVRARQTAEVLLEALALEQPPPLVVEPLLAPGVAVAQMAMAVAAPRVESAGPGRGERQPRVEPILAVGHEPSLSRLAGHLCGAPELRLELKKGGLVEIELAERDPPRGALLGLLRPGHLR
jgi:phosphohistidine phosphatase SixA